jgi:hypothetical protein
MTTHGIGGKSEKDMNVRNSSMGMGGMVDCTKQLPPERDVIRFNSRCVAVNRS